MPWLNWSLKFHIRLRTISLLIPTHNTQVYVQWMPYSFMLLYLIKCVFTYSIFVDSNTKRFLSVLVVFGKYFVRQILKNSKTVLPCFGNSVTSKSSHVIQSRFHRSFLANCSRVKGPVLKGTQRFSLLILRLPREWDFQSQKTLRKFFKILTWSALAGDLGDSLATYLSRKNRMLCKMSSFSTLFSKRVFICLSCILWLFTFWSYFQYFNISMVISKIFNHFVTILSICKERYGFSPLLFICYHFVTIHMVFVLYLIFVYLLPMFGYLCV